jgi:HAD superfamily hydrolase (TIGR01509 family)
MPFFAKKTMPVKNLLFDLGKVLYEIDIDGMVDRFNALIPSDKKKLSFSMEGQPGMFDLLDKGQIGVDDFVQSLQAYFDLQASASEVMEAWHSILVGVIPGRIEALKRFAQRYELGLLSNTNAVHHHRYLPEVKPLLEPMKHVFLSFEMGMRKPDPAIYQQVLKETGWRAEETLFIDDGLKNTEAARRLGFQTLHFRSEDDFTFLIENYL